MRHLRVIDGDKKEFTYQFNALLHRAKKIVINKKLTSPFALSVLRLHKAVANMRRRKKPLPPLNANIEYWKTYGKLPG